LIKGKSKSNHLDAQGTLKGALQRYAIFLFEIPPAHAHERASTKSFVVLSIGDLKSNHSGAQGTLTRITRGVPTYYEQALVSLKLKKTIDAGTGRTFAVLIEGG